MKVQGLKGTRDFYPQEMRVLNYIFNTWRSVAAKFGYEEFDGPMLEPIDLWTLKSGAEIPEQMYRFTDKSGKEIAVRPELTPTLARMVAEKQKELAKPIKWFSIPRCWRYEAPQSGRLREFFQLNVDCLGIESMQADAEVIATAVEIMKSFGCTSNDFYVRMCNRRLITALLQKEGIKDIQGVCRLLDKICKLAEPDLKASLKDLGLNPKQVEFVLKMIKMKLDDVKQDELGEEGKKGYQELKELIDYLKAYGLFEYCKVDFSIMRGFDYYTSTVFEIFDMTKEFRAIAGGGRYDNLVGDFGGEKCPGVGYGMGDVVIEMFLRKLKLLPSLTRGVDYFVAPVSKEVVPQAIGIAEKLRKKSTVELELLERKLKKQFEYADSIGAKKIVIVGEKDLKDKCVTIRDLKSGKEEKVKLSNI